MVISWCIHYWRVGGADDHGTLIASRLFHLDKVYRPQTLILRARDPLKSTVEPWPWGSKDPNNRGLEPKYYNMNGIWALKPYYLGPWTLRVGVQVYQEYPLRTLKPTNSTYLALRVQVPNNHILTQNLYYQYYYPNPKYLTIGYMDPLGLVFPGAAWVSYKIIPALSAYGSSIMYNKTLL